MRKKELKYVYFCFFNRSFSSRSSVTFRSFSLAVLSTQRFRESTAREISSSFWLINAKSLISSSEIFPSRAIWISLLVSGLISLRQAIGLQDNIGEFADFHFRNVALPDGAFMGAVVIAKIRAFVAVRHLHDVVRSRLLCFVFNFFNPGGRNSCHQLTCFLAGEFFFFPA